MGWRKNWVFFSKCFVVARTRENISIYILLYIYNFMRNDEKLKTKEICSYCTMGFFCICMHVCISVQTYRQTEETCLYSPCVVWSPDNRPLSMGPPSQMIEMCVVVWGPHIQIAKLKKILRPIFGIGMKKYVQGDEHQEKTKK